MIASGVKESPKQAKGRSSEATLELSATRPDIWPNTTGTCGHSHHQVIGMLSSANGRQKRRQKKPQTYNCKGDKHEQQVRTDKGERRRKKRGTVSTYDRLRGNKNNRHLVRGRNGVATIAESAGVSGFIAWRSEPKRMLRIRYFYTFQSAAHKRTYNPSSRCCCFICS